MSQILKIISPHVSQFIVKKSLFVTSVCKASTVADAKAFIEHVRDLSASHNCWAYRIGESNYRFSDDGEPSGTAGRPIYAAICANNIDDVVVVVTRYFGGIKLGAGGLIRAYSRATTECLRDAPKVELSPTADLSIAVTWEHIGVVQAIAERHERLDTVFNDSGCTIVLRVALDEEQKVRQEILDASKGFAKIE
ncbi:hypothetical protein BWQ96_08715 [Gracilariopsis chorda]|uniref:Impact N-terminal domain-containing protein n=1 Tax=Gracilariopsis chorda TaxID=448386 RepID=A0A2V3IKB7_9FLOR|nr:hypothetical protein BWQ96_08715 [Gracilariopsis chorda]|eukprot:PXF41570.1 hypothetical protein BWQ96_08715 [Gracilariopsis chorda]